jgi:colicin import membrane protein
MNQFLMRCGLLWACGLLACVPAQADDRQERTRIARERDEATLRFQQRQRECEQRFAVTACVDEARAEHRQALSRLRGQESVLDEAERKRRAALRMAAIREKVSAEAARDASPRPVRPAPAMQVSEPRQKAASPAVSRPASAASAPERSAQEARSRERFEKRQRDARAHRDEAARRQAERAKPGKSPVAPLPDPAGR